MNEWLVMKLGVERGLYNPLWQNMKIKSGKLCVVAGIKTDLYEVYHLFGSHNIPAIHTCNIKWEILKRLLHSLFVLDILIQDK